MSQRNMMNDRNISDSAKPVGKTRKSAASAKPASKAASSVYVPADSGSKPKKKSVFDNFRDRNTKDETPKERKEREAREARKQADKERRREISRYRPTGAEYRKWRLVFWAFMGASVLCMLPVTFGNVYQSNYVLYVTMLIFAWGFLTAAIITQIRKVKPAKEEEYYKQASARKVKKKK